MILRKMLTLSLVLALVFSFMTVGRVLAEGTDEIREFTIDIAPQHDGTLINTYSLDWCVISNAAGPLSWFNIGMPNEHYEILSFNGDAIAVTPDNSGFDYRMRIDLAREVNAGDCVAVSVKVHQSSLAYLDDATGEIDFQFIPGWFDEIPVDLLRLTWQLPADAAWLKSFDPQPSSQDGAQAVWETALQPGEKFTLNVAYDQAAFPDYDPDSRTPGGSDIIGSGKATSSAAVPEDVDTPSYQSPPVSRSPLSLALSACACVPILAFIIILVVILSILSNVRRSYRRGGYFGGYNRIPMPSRGSSRSPRRSSGSSRSPSRSGGGSGKFGGRGSSCACVSSGCACACAGGGRAGCSRKGFDVSALLERSAQRER